MDMVHRLLGRVPRQSRVRSVVAGAALLAATGSAQAQSCPAVFDVFYVECSADRCTDGFWVLYWPPRGSPVFDTIQCPFLPEIYHLEDPHLALISARFAEAPDRHTTTLWTARAPHRWGLDYAEVMEQMEFEARSQTTAVPLEALQREADRLSEQVSIRPASEVSLEAARARYTAIRQVILGDSARPE